MKQFRVNRVDRGVCFQADRLCDEAHKVASDQCMWVSSELKRARSLVRIAEIQSTLHEQR